MQQELEIQDAFDDVISPAQGPTGDDENQVSSSSANISVSTSSKPALNGGESEAKSSQGEGSTANDTKGSEFDSEEDAEEEEDDDDDDEEEEEFMPGIDELDSMLEEGMQDYTQTKKKGNKKTQKQNEEGEANKGSSGPLEKQKVILVGKSRF